MQCSSCGMQIPYDGHFCPFCGANKIADKQEHDRSQSTACIAIVILPITAYVGYLVTGGFGGGVIGFFLGVAALSNWRR